MAREITVRLKDDLDGSDADRTIQFSWDGIAYEIDLNSVNASVFSEAFGPWVFAARRTNGARRGRRAAGSGGSRRVGGTDFAAVCAWANSNGYPVSTRGRIPAMILQAYDQLRGAGARTAPRSSSRGAASALPRKAVRKAPVRERSGKEVSGGPAVGPHGRADG